jgi:hypothetical protein
MTLERDFTVELETYRQHEQELQDRLGEWVVIKGTEILGVYPTLEEAIYTEGAQHGLDHICVQEIMPVGHCHTISRLLGTP